MITTDAPRWVLLVDDTGNDVELYSMHLQSAGFNVVTGNNGQQGLEKARDWNPQIIVADVMLPDFDGWELCRRLKLEPALSDIPIIVLTARPERDGAERARRAGCAAYLTKPCLPDTLVDEVSRVLGVSAARAE